MPLLKSRRSKKTASMGKKSTNSSVFVAKLKDFSSSKRHYSAEGRTATRATKSCRRQAKFPRSVCALFFSEDSRLAKHLAGKWEAREWEPNAVKFKGWAGSLCTRSDIIAGRSRANLSAQSARRKPHNTYQNMYITTQTKIGEEKEVTLFPPQIHLVEGLQTQTFNLFVIKPDIYQRQYFRDDRCLKNRHILILNIAVLMRTRFVWN